MRAFADVIAILNVRERIWMAVLVVATLVAAALQVAGVGSVMPVLSLIADPDAVHQNAVLEYAFEQLGFATARGFLIFVGIMAVVVVVLSNAFLAMTMWLISRFTWNLHHRLSADLLKKYMYSPYSMFLDRNTADLRKNLLQEIERFAGNVVGPLLSLCAFAMTAIFLVAFLVWLNPAFAALAVFVLGGGYVLLFLGVRRSLMNAGVTRLEADRTRHKIVAEALDSIKETKVLGVEEAFVRRFDGPTRHMASAMIRQQVLGQVPRYAIEAFAFGSILVGAVYFISIGSSLRDLITVVGVYAFAGYRLLPAVQNAYQSWSTVRFHQPVSETIYRDIGSASDRGAITPAGQSDARDRLAFTKAVRFEGVTFSYPGAVEPTIKDITLAIPRGSVVALVGETGAGKTTVADIILGLFRPQQGAVFVDDVALDSESAIRRWQNNVGYVPQDIFLADDSIAANIGFGLADSEIDMTAVERASKVANIHRFITTELPDGYRTNVGERGIRLSGGQRQRIGIARALYRDPSVLVLDEATSNLDAPTESEIHAAILSLGRSITVVLIAHRLSTTRDCDVLFAIDKGRLVASGTYAEIVDGDRLGLRAIDRAG